MPFPLLLLIVWAVGLVILFLIRGYMLECHPHHDICDDDAVPLLVIWPIFVGGMMLIGLIGGPFWLANRAGKFVGRHCGCGKRER